MRVTMVVQPNTIWVGAESLNQNRRLQDENSCKSLPMARPAPDRQQTAKPDWTIGRASKSVSLTYLNGCKANTKTVDRRCVGQRRGNC